VVIGHSSGGYFGAWLAGPSHLPATSEIATLSPLKLAGMIMLDAFLDPGVIDSRGTSGEYFCREPILDRLRGGTAELASEHLKQISPLQLLPFGIAQEYVVSSRRYPVSPPRALADGRTTYAVADYPAMARSAGEKVSLRIVPDAGHMDFITPGTQAWAAVEAAVVRIFGL